MVARRKPVVSTDFVGWMAIVVTSRKVRIYYFLGLATFSLSKGYHLEYFWERQDTWGVTSHTDMAELGGTENIQVVAETLVVSITIASTLTSTILVTLERLEWKISLMDIFFQNGMTTKTWASAVGSFENNTILYLKYFLPYLVLLGKESCLS